jgi:hypothetical protein
MDLKDEIVGGCTLCNGVGYIGIEACQCLIKFRTYNRLVNGGFNKDVIDFCLMDNYELPYMELGENFIEFFVNNLDKVDKKGLSLILYSQYRGRGKTTLSHYLSYKYMNNFMDTSNYDRDRTCCFEFVSDFIDNFEDRNWKSKLYVLDDLGNEDLGGWKKEVQITRLQRVLQHRRMFRLPTIITTNYPPRELSEKYSGVLDSLLEIGVGDIVGGERFKGVCVGGVNDLRSIEENDDWV